MRTLDRTKTILQAIGAQFSVPITRILLSLTVVRLYSEAYWGTYVQYFLIVQLVGALINLGSKDYLVRTFSRHPERIAKVLQASIFARLSLALLVVILLYLVPFGKLDSGILIAWILAQLSWQFFEALNIYLRLFWQTAVVELSLILVLIGLVLLDTFSIQSFLWLIVASELIKGLIYWGLNRQFLTFQWVLFSDIRQFFRAVFPFLLLVIAGALASRGELYLLAIQLKESILGQYQVLSNFVQSSHLLASAVLLPFLKNLYRIKAEVLMKLEKQFLLLGLFTTPILTLAIFVVLCYGYGFNFSWQVYLLIGALIFLYCFQVIRIQILFRQDQVHRVTLILILMGVVKVVVGWWLIGQWGISGALTAAGLAYLAGNVAFWQVPIKSLAR